MLKSARLTRLARFVGAFLLLGLAACAASVQPPTLEPTIGPTSPALPVVRPTLPPSWTPTLTYTPAPTMTHLPTLTPAPTLSLDDICHSLQLLSPLPDGLYIPWDGNVTISVTVGVGAVYSYILTPTPAIVGSGTPTPSVDDQTPVAIRFLATHRLSGKNLGFQAPGGQGVIVTLPVNRLPLPGLYDWTLTVYSPAFGSPCPGLKGYFIVGAPAEGTPEVTSEATSEASPTLRGP